MFRFGKANKPQRLGFIVLDTNIVFIIDEHWTISVNA